MRAGFVLAAVLAAAGCAMDGREPPETVLWAKDGRALAQIVIAADAGRIERFAASELKLHLDEMTGADFKIVSDAAPSAGYEIRVGESRRTKQKNADFDVQEYSFCIGRDSAELIGYDRKTPGSGMPGLYDLQGTMYAVYEFLEKDCGVRWLNPTDYGTYVPKAPTLAVAVRSRRGKPAFRMRGGAGFDNRKPILWKEGSEGAARYNAFAFASVKAGTVEMRNRQRLFFLRHRAGGEYAIANHSFYGWYPRFLEKKDANFEGYHPEYFAKDQPGRPSQLCYTNPGAIAQAVKDARAYFDNGGYKVALPGTRVGYHWGENDFCLEPMDGAGFCRCKECLRYFEPERIKEGSGDSTVWFRFVNAVAKELKKSHPGKTISTLAYSTHEGLPTGVTLEDNVKVHFCVSANRSPTLKLHDDQLARMKQWRDTYPNMKIAMWLYNCFPKLSADSGNFHAFPGYFAHAAEKEFRFFRDIRATEGIFYDGFDGDVDSYLHLAWMLDPSRSADELLDEFFAPYGDCGRHLRRFYTIIEERYCDPRNWPPEEARGENVKIAWGHLGTPEVMAELDRALKDAEAAAKNDFERGTVRLVRLGVWDYMKAGFDEYQMRSASPMPTWTAKRVPAGAAGEPDKVDWSGVKPLNVSYYERGSDNKQPFACEMRLGHDGSYLYVELVEHVDPSKLENASRIMPCDTWEFLMAADRAQPYRYYITGPDGRFCCLSYGEINWRQMVPAEESGDLTFKAKAKNDFTSFKDRWIARYSFPLDWAASTPLKPGETLYMNVTRVMCAALAGKDRFQVYTLTPYTTVHTADRTASVLLEK